MKTQHKITPGPWVLNTRYCEVYDTEGRKIARINYSDPVEVRTANARLIKEAPAMLEALEALLGCTELNLDDLEPDTRYTIENALAVIAQATGEE